MQSKSSPGVILMAETPEQRNLSRTGWSQTLVGSRGLQDFQAQFSPQFSIRARARQASVSTARLSKGDCTGQGLQRCFRVGRSCPWNSPAMVPLREPRGSVGFSHLIKQENSPGSWFPFVGSWYQSANSVSVFGLSLLLGPRVRWKKLLDETVCLEKYPP